MSEADDSPGVLTLIRSIHDLVIRIGTTVDEMKQTMARHDERVKNLEQMPRQLEKTLLRVALLENRESKINGITVGASAAVAAVLGTVGWVIIK